MEQLKTFLMIIDKDNMYEKRMGLSSLTNEYKQRRKGKKQIESLWKGELIWQA